MTSTYPVASSSNNSGSSYQGIIDAFNLLRLNSGEDRKYYPPNYQGVVSAILDLRDWGNAGAGPLPPSWEIVVDEDGDQSGIWNPRPENGTLWFDTRQGRLFIYMDDGFYQTNGSDGIPSFSDNPPAIEVQGALWYNTATGTLYIWDGSTWVALTSQTGFSTETLMLSNPVTSTFQTGRAVLPDANLQTQADYNQYNYQALIALEDALIANNSAEPTPTGTSLPGTGAEGDLFYKTDENVLYIYSGSAWETVTPLPDVTAADVSAVQSNLDAHIVTHQADITSIEQDIHALQQEDHHIYTLGTGLATGAGDGITPGIYLKDDEGTSTGLTINGAGAIAVAEGQFGITIAAAAIESSLAAIESDYLTSADKTELEDTICNDEARITAIEETQTSLLNSLNALSASVGELPSLADVQSRLSAAGGALSGALDMQNNPLQNLPAPIQAGDAATKAYSDAMDTSIRADHVLQNGGILQSVAVNNTNLDKAAFDFSGQAIYGKEALKFKTLAPGSTDHFVTFGTSENNWEYSWNYASDEAFNWINNGTRVFAISGNNAYAKDVVLCNLTANSTGPQYTNQISVRTKLEDLDTAVSNLTTQLNQLTFDTSTKHVYYGDTAPTVTVEDGDIWFDSHNLRLNIRHGGYWVFPDRVEDVALKSALFNAVNTSTDYDSLKSALLTALS